MPDVSPAPGRDDKGRFAPGHQLYLRKAGPSRWPLSIRLRTEEYDLLCRRALREDTTITALVREAVMRLLGVRS